MSQPEPIRIGQQLLALHQPSYFIADIAANHDGDLARAKALIRELRKRVATSGVARK